MRSSNFIIEHQCPQCGAPATLTETERLFQCDFCRVRSYLCTKDVFRYVLPHKAPEDKSIFYFPYWRFKGMLYSCVPFQIRNKWLDVSHQAIRSAWFPHTLGFRSQALKLRFMTPDLPGAFLHVAQSLPRALETIVKRFSDQGGDLFHQAYIGETLSLIYAPYYQEDKLYDAVLNEPARLQPNELDIDISDTKRSKWKLDFLPTLCPNCGWDMVGQPDAQVLHCLNCHKAWQAHKNRFVEVRYGTIPLDPQAEALQYLPFWRIRAEIKGLDLDSYADLVKVANLPLVPQQDWQSVPFYFWGPAFKIRPQTFMALSSRLTLRQPREKIESAYPKSETIHPVNLPVLEAVEALKINLASFMTRKQDNFPLLAQIGIRPKSYRLVYLPFIEKRMELLQPMFSININRSQLHHAKNL